jgi:hypothetical protein
MGENIMKWMEHDRKRKRLIFKLEEHEIVDGMQHHLYFSHPETNEKDANMIDVHIGPSVINSNWELIFFLPDELPLHLGRCEFFVNGHSAMKGSFIVATGFTVASNIVCHQALSKRTSK